MQFNVERNHLPILPPDHSDWGRFLQSSLSTTVRLDTRSQSFLLEKLNNGEAQLLTS